MRLRWTPRPLLRCQQRILSRSTCPLTNPFDFSPRHLIQSNLPIRVLLMRRRSTRRIQQWGKEQNLRHSRIHLSARDLEKGWSWSSQRKQLGKITKDHSLPNQQQQWWSFIRRLMPHCLHMPTIRPRWIPKRWQRCRFIPRLIMKGDSNNVAYRSKQSFVILLIVLNLFSKTYQQNYFLLYCLYSIHTN